MSDPRTTYDTSMIGFEAADPPQPGDFSYQFTEGRIRLSEWLPDFEDYANELFYLVLTGTNSQAVKFAEDVLKKAERLWEKE